MVAGAPGQIGGRDVLQLQAEVQPLPQSRAQHRKVRPHALAGIGTHALAHELQRAAHVPGALALAVRQQQSQLLVTLVADLVLQVEQPEQLRVGHFAVVVRVELVAQVVRERDVVHAQPDQRHADARLLAAEQAPRDRLHEHGEVAVDQVAEPLGVHEQHLAPSGPRQAGRVPERGRGVIGHGRERRAHAQRPRAAAVLHERAGVLVGVGDARQGGARQHGGEQTQAPQRAHRVDGHAFLAIQG